MEVYDRKGVSYLKLTSKEFMRNQYYFMRSGGKAETWEGEKDTFHVSYFHFLFIEGNRNVCCWGSRTSEQDKVVSGADTTSHNAGQASYHSGRTKSTKEAGGSKYPQHPE